MLRPFLEWFSSWRTAQLLSFEVDNSLFPFRPVTHSQMLLQGVVASVNVEEALKDVEYAVLVGAFPRKEGMERKDLLEKNCAIFKEQGTALAKVASKNVKVLVVGNPANTNALIALTSAAGAIPKENFTALTRLDHNRARNQVSRPAVYLMA